MCRSPTLIAFIFFDDSYPLHYLHPAVAKGGIAQLVPDERLGPRRGQTGEEVERRVVRLGQANQDPVVAMEATDRNPQTLAEPGLERKLQRLVQLCTERREHRETHFSRRVAVCLDQDGPVVGDRAPGDADLACDVVAWSTSHGGPIEPAASASSHGRSAPSS